MGGFVTREGHHPIVTKAQLGQYLTAIKAIPEADIEDKSKDDNLLKFLTLAQVVWFAMQIVARLTKSLPISALETATVAFAVIHIVTWGFWRKKPRGVSEAIPIDAVVPAHPEEVGCKTETIPCHLAGEADVLNRSATVNGDRLTLVDEMEANASHRRLAVGDHLNAILFGEYRNYDPMSSTSVPSFSSVPPRRGLNAGVPLDASIATSADAIDKSGTHLVTSGNDKVLKLWQIDGLKLLNERELPKKSTGLTFTLDGQTILASDKFGNIFRYISRPLQIVPKLNQNRHHAATNCTRPPQTVEQKRALASHDNPSGGKLILGHAFFFAAFLLSSADEKYIITADRDEHILISCLGHQKFVSALHIPAFAPAELVSGGGDPVLKARGQDVAAVRGRRRGGRGGERQEEGRKAKARGKQKAEADEGAAIIVPEPVEDAAEVVPEPAERPDTVFTLRRIESLIRGRRAISFPVPSAQPPCSYVPTPRTTPHRESARSTLGRPSFAADGLIWVSLDGRWGGSDADTDAAVVRVLRLSAGSLVGASDGPSAPLPAALNSKYVLPVTPADLAALDLYLALAALPKNSDAAHDPMDCGPLEGAGSAKELGRWRGRGRGGRGAKRVRAGSEPQEGEGEDEDEEGEDGEMDVDVDVDVDETKHESADGGGGAAGVDEGSVNA
ncbi:hypothetical protein DFH07DRAFT_1021031 [Mycena maculata]|uniref:WD40 repeat-like protein n=1 Tax=Mycena maculata TaxID=230809 RepID=A0AAD7JDT1_9AGAR|nr:hypothetical protein DFH07DRAFT_1021031 [Mycena maculata]